MKKNLLILVMLVWGSWAVFAQPMLRYRLSGTAGWLNRDDKIAGTKTMQGLTLDRPVVAGATFAVEFLPTGKLSSLQQWNNASIGVAATYLNLGQNQYLGSLYTLWSYLNIPLVNTPHFVFGLRPGVGVAFADRRYSNTVPEELKWQAYQQPNPGSDKPNMQIANISIGSVANAFLNGGIYMDFPIKNGVAVTIAGGWQHASNGSVLTPNAGYNMFNAELGLTYTPSEDQVKERTPQTDVPHHLYDGVQKKWDVEIGLAGGVRSVYYRDQKVFGIGELTVAAHWQPVSIFRLGAGVDLFYDGAYRSVYYQLADASNTAPRTYYKKTYLAEGRVEDCFRLGFSLQPDFVIGRLTVGYHLGFYLYDPIKNLEPFGEAEAAAKEGKSLHRGIFYGYDMSKASNYQDGWFYQRVQLKYRPTEHFYVQLSLKLHIMKAEYLALGVGFRI